MRCSSKLTRWAASLVLAVALTLGCATPTVAGQAPAYDEAAVRLAVVDAVRARLGGDAEITLDKVKIVLASTGPVVATPEPGARVGRIVRFMLVPAAPSKSGTSSAAGYVLADVRAAVRHLEVVRPVTHGSELTADDLAEVVGDVGLMPMAPMPVLADVVGSHASRDMKPGDLITAAMLKSQPLVRSGDAVRTRAVIGQVEVVGRAVAQQSGQRNDRIKLINPDSRKSLTGLVTGAGEVVIVHEK